MPSPVGHALGGLAIGWIGESDRRIMTPLVWTAAALAIAPDLDILAGSHQTYSHSIGAAVLFGAAVGLLVSIKRPHGLTDRSRLTQTVLICIAAYGSHLLLDWLGKDSSPPIGLMLWWPMSDRFFKSGADLFLEVSRRYWRPEEFVWGNLRAVTREVTMLAPVVLGAYWIRVRRGRALRERRATR